MNNKLIIFGIGKIADVIAYYAQHDCGYEVVAYCVDEAYKNVAEFYGKPVVSFSEVEQMFTPDAYRMFIAVGYHNLNKLREERCQQAIAKGYQLVNIVCPLANLPSNVQLGYNCFIMAPAVIHPFVTMGNNVFVWSGSIVGHHSTIGDHCWLTSGCNIGGNVLMGTHTFVALNATVTHSVRIGNRCFLGSNALVAKDLEDDKVVIAESSKPLRLTSEQFLRMSAFESL